MKTQALSPFKALVASLALLLAANGLLADAVTEAAVKKMATGWLKTSASVNGVKMGRSISRVQAIPDASGNTLYYAVQLSPEGFLLVAADDQLSPVICFSKGGQYTVDKVPPLTDLVTGESTAKLNTLKKFRLSKSLNAKTASLLSANKSDWSFFTAQASAIVRTTASGNTRNTTYIDTNNTYVPPLVKSKWNQQGVANEALYNYYTPSTWSEPDAFYPALPTSLTAADITPPPVTWTEGLVTNFPVGCTATAKAQLIRYHQYPTAGIGANSYQIWVRKHLVTVDGDHQWTQNCTTRGGNGAGGAYDYTKMPLVPDASMTVEERQMIGALLFDCSISNNMFYTPEGSGGTIRNWDIFGYVGVKFNCSQDEVRANLDAGYPVTVTVVNTYTNIDIAGHSIVCDGYVLYPSGRNASGDQGAWYFHMNMGWGGAEDAWYNADGIYTQVWDYNDATFTGNIYPDNKRDAYGATIAGTDRILSGRIVDPSGYPIQGLTVVVADAADLSDSTRATTDAKGIYSFVLPQNAYRLTPDASNYAFTPASRVASLLDINLPDNNFTGVTTPTVATKGVFSVTDTGALFVGAAVTTGGTPVTSRGFCWGVSPSPDTDNDSVVVGTGLGTFEQAVNALEGGKTYHVRAFSTNAQGTNYGGDFTFKTND